MNVIIYVRKHIFHDLYYTYKIFILHIFME